MDRLILVAPLYLSDKSGTAYGGLVADLANILSAIVSNDSKNGSISFIQKTRSCDFIADLARLAGTEDRAIRLPSSSALINIVDDTTIELVASFILPMLRENKLDGAFNLLQVVRVVSYSALSDTRDKLIPAISDVEHYMSSAPADMAKSQQTVQEIKALLQANSSRKKTSDVYSVEPCRSANFSLAVSAVPKIAYIHTAVGSYPTEYRTRLLSIVQSYGVKVIGFDSDVDTQGGAGVDYFDESDRTLAQQLATSIGDFIHRTPFSPRKQSSKINQPGVFGIWLPPPPQ